MKPMVLSLNRRVKCKVRELRRTTSDKGLAVRCQIVLLAGKQRSRVAIAESLGCSLSWIGRVISRFREFGIAGLMDRREDNGQTKLDERWLSMLHEVVGGSPQQHGCPRPTWTRELLVAVMENLTGVRVHVGTMSRALGMIRARRGRPRPVVNCCPWPTARKNRVLAAIDAMLENLKPSSETAVYLDEVDIHLNPKIGLDWMNRGQQKQVITPGNNVKRYVCGAEDAAGTGKLTWVLADRKNSLLFIATLRQLLRRYPDRKVIHVICDNFSIHDSGQTQAWLAEHGQRIRLHFLPPYCPQHNRIERLWLDLHAEVTRNHTCKTIEELIERVVQFLIERNRYRIAHKKAA